MTPFILPMPKSVSLKDLATWKKSADEAGVDRIWFSNDAEGLQQDVASRALCATASDVVVLCSPDDCSRKPAFLQEVSATIGLLAASCEEDVAVGLKTECLEHAATLGAVGIVIRNALENIPAQIVPLALSHGMPHGSASALHGQLEELIQAILRHLSDAGTGNTRQTPPGCRRRSRG